MNHEPLLEGVVVGRHEKFERLVIQLDSGPTVLRHPDRVVTPPPHE
jgi:hypothetical protein